LVDDVNRVLLVGGDAAGGAPIICGFGRGWDDLSAASLVKRGASTESPEQGRKDKAREGASDDQTSPGSNEFVRRHGGFWRAI
jgi:hypothetical protein